MFCKEKLEAKQCPVLRSLKKPESSPKSNLQKYEYPPNTKWRHEEDSARLLCAIKKNQKLKIISPKCRVPHLIGPFSQFRPDFLFFKKPPNQPLNEIAVLSLSLSLYRNLWNYLLHTNDFTLYIKEIRPFFMPIWRLKNPPLADCVHRSKKNQYHKTLDICTCWQKVQSLKTAHSSKTPWPSHMSHVQSSQANDPT